MNPGDAAALAIEVAPAPDEALRAAIAAPLLAHNEALAGPSGHRTLALVLRDASGGIAGGLWGATAHRWLYVQMLVVPAAARGRGLGAALMRRAEDEARARGCIGAWVDTQFGARAFYERLGYAVFGELPDYPPGFVRSFLFKRLEPAR